MKQSEKGDAKNVDDRLIFGGYIITSRINEWEVAQESSPQMKSEGSVRVVIQRLTGSKRLPAKSNGIERGSNGRTTAGC